MKVTELKQDTVIIEWLETMNAKPNTEKAYLQGMQDFTSYTGKDSETLLEEAAEDIRAGRLNETETNKKRPHRLQEAFTGFGESSLNGEGANSGSKVFF